MALAQVSRRTDAKDKSSPLKKFATAMDIGLGVANAVGDLSKLTGGASGGQSPVSNTGSQGFTLSRSPAMQEFMNMSPLQAIARKKK